MKQSMFITGAMFSLLTLSLFSCKKSDDTTPEVEPPVVAEARPLLDSVITIAASPEWNSTTAYRYNADSTQYADISINANGGAQGVFFLYSNKQLIRFVFSETGNVNDTTNGTTFIYDTKGRLIIRNPDNWANRDSLVYNDANQLVRIFKYYSDELYYADTLTWTGKNLTRYKSVQYIYGSEDRYVETHSFKYDDKRNPFVSVPVSAFFFPENICRLSENNIVEYSDEVEGGRSNTTKYTYTYNDKNYPTNAAYVLTGEGVSDEGTIRFVYKK